MGPLTINHHPAKSGGHGHCGNRDLMFLMVDELDFICLFTSVITIFSKPHGMSSSPTRNFKLSEPFLHNHFSSVSNEISSALVTRVLGNNL